MARTREFDPAEALQSAIQVFWEKGYAETSVDEIVARSGVAKYGIYGTFGPKRDLFFRALEQYERDRHADIQEPIRRSGAGLAEIREFFANAAHLMSSKAAPAGCLVNNTGIELGPRDPEIREFVNRFFRDIGRVLRRCVDRAIDAGDLSPTTDRAGLARYLVNEFRTVLLLGRNGHSRRDIDSHLGFALSPLD